MRKILSLAGLLVLALALVGPAAAGKTGFLKTWSFGDASAEWTKEGLVLTKNAPTAEVAAAGADFKFAVGEQLTSLSFEFKDSAYHGAGAPRFSVRFAGESGYRFYSSTTGTLSPGSAAGWTKVTFGGFGTTDVEDLFLVQDETGTAVLRNIEVNGVTVDKFPNG
jgi:hypothetical protein